MFLTNDEIKTHLYAENVNVIQRGDETILTAAVQGAIVEAKGYLKAYDLDKVFGAMGDERNPLLLIMSTTVRHWENILLEKNIDATKLQTKIKRADYLPTVAVGASYLQNNFMDK